MQSFPTLWEFTKFSYELGERLIESLQDLHLLTWHQCHRAKTKQSSTHRDGLPEVCLPSYRGQTNVVSVATCCRLILSWRVSTTWAITQKQFSP